MTSTIDSLWEFKLTYPVLADYFGLHNTTNDEDIIIIRGIYDGLYQMDVPKELVEQHFYSNTLDELIHDEYKEIMSEYYREFCRRNIKIGSTYRVVNSISEEDEDDEDDGNSEVINEAYQKYGKDWVNQQRKIQLENIDEIMIKAHDIQKNPNPDFYDCVYDKYGKKLLDKYLQGIEVDPITPEEVNHWVNYALKL